MVDEQTAKEILNSQRNEIEKYSTPDTDILGVGKLGDTLSDNKYLLKHSIITPDIPPKLAILYAINHQIKSPILTEYLEVFLASQISVKGQGRKDILSLAKSLSMAISGLTRDDAGGWKNPFKRGDSI